MKDLLCLAYGEPLGITVREARSHQDGSRARVCEPQFARWGSPSFAEGSPGPALFRLGDADRAKLANWLQEPKWRRATWIAASAFIAEKVPLEISLIQVCIALEALAQAAAPSKKYDKWNDLLHILIQAVPFEAISPGQNPEAWSNRLRAAYVGSKHADKPLPEPKEAFQFRAEAMNLFRSFVAVSIGCRPEVLADRLR